MRIIVVEDEATIREGLSNLINENTHHTVIAKCKNGLEGIEIIPQLKPDLVITDIRMNEMDGLQMLSKLREMGENVNSVILSGYSEFEYAREAIRLGVEEYLLKPISIDSVNRILKKIEEEIETEQASYVAKPEAYLKSYILGGSEEREQAKEYFESTFGLKEQEKYAIFNGYLRNANPEEMEDIKYQFRNLKRQQEEEGRFLAYFDESNCSQIFLVKGTVQSIRDFEDDLMEKMKSIRSIREKEIPWAGQECDSIEQWYKTYLHVRKMLSYGTILGYREMIHKEQIEKLSFKGFRYPTQLEKKIISAMGDGNSKAVKEGIEKFCSYLRDDQYEPDDIRHAALRFATNINETAREINQKAFDEMKSKEYPQDILQSRTVSEWEEILFEMGSKVCDRERKEGISNYTINKTLEYIRVHYMEGITLEETAQMLEITPEYLSTLFKREMGMNFSAFLKEFRISHAKRLLKGSNMRIYEVAEACGYSNSNYFTKVFKEVTGISPVEFR